MNYRRLKNEIKYFMPEKLSAQIVYLKNYHRFINYKAPELMDEKLLILKEQYAKNPEIKSLIDKFKVRDYLKSVGYESILNELYQVCDAPEQIQWDKLPGSYVIKCNHGSGYNIIVPDASKLDRAHAVGELKKWLKEDYGFISGEKQYCDIPRKIIIEKYLQTKEGHFPPDFKFFVSYGNVIGCMIAVNRDTDLKRFFVDTDFNDMHFIHEYEKPDYKKYKPASWNEQLKIASVLGKKFPFVRVDLYDLDGKVLFGELTFTPDGCIHNHFSMESQKYIGARISMSNSPTA